MTPIEFPEMTVIIAKDQPEYLPLPAHNRFPYDDKGRIAFCWKMSWKERLRALIRGVIWHEVLTFSGPLQPQLLTLDKPAMDKPPEVTQPFAASAQSTLRFNPYSSHGLAQKVSPPGPADPPGPVPRRVG